MSVRVPALRQQVTAGHEAENLDVAAITAIPLAAPHIASGPGSDPEAPL